MSLFDYKRSRELRGQPFYALLMAAIAEADTFNFDKLSEAFPDVAHEVVVRYEAPGGLLPGERDGETGLRRTESGLLDDAGKLVREC